MNDSLIKFSAIVKSSIKKIFSSRKIIFPILGLVFIAAVMGYASTQEVDKIEMGTTLMEGLILSFLVPVITMVYGSTIIRDEIEDKSITQVITSPIGRIRAYLGYYLAIVMSLGLILFLITTGGFLSFFGPLGIDSASVTIYSNVLALVLMGILVYSALFMLVSIMTSKSIYFGLFYVFIWEGFVGSLPGNIQKVAIRHYLRSIASSWMEHVSINVTTGISISFLVILVLMITLVILGCVSFRRKEFP